MPTPLLAALTLAFATVAPETVPPEGTQTALVTLQRAGLVRIEAVTPVKASCRLVDHRRGPFASATTGDDGRCVIEDLLDAGPYRLLVEGPREVKGTPGPVRLRVVSYKDVDDTTPRLDAGTRAKTTLPVDTVRRFVVRSDGKRAVRLHVVGRTAGRVELWRDATWREGTSFRKDTLSPTGTGRPLHHWRYDGVLAEGAYVLAVYGTGALPWENGGTDDALVVANGAPPVVDGKSMEVAFDGSGLVLVDLPVGTGRVVSMVKQLAGQDVVRIDAVTLDEAGMPVRVIDCRLSLDPLRPVCSMSAGGEKRATGLILRGPKDARVLLAWLPFDVVHGPFSGGGPIEGNGRSMRFALHELPAAHDEAPVSCELIETQRIGDRVEHRSVAQDPMRIGTNGSYEGRFNYDGRRAVVRFASDLRARHTIDAAGGRKSRCTLKDLRDGRRIFETETGKTGCAMSLLLDRGTYELELREGIPGIEALSIHVNAPAAPPVRGKAGCRFDAVPTLRDATYEVVATRPVITGGLRGVSAAGVEDPLAGPFAVGLDPGGRVSFPVPAGAVVQAWSLPGGALACETPDGVIQPERGTCALPARPTAWTVTYRNVQDRPIVLLADRATKSPVPLVPPNDRLEPPVLPKLALDVPVGRDFPRSSAHSFTFDVAGSALYRVTTEGLLATRCELRTPAVLSLASATGGGRGRNCLLSEWLAPGRYRLVVSTHGASAGRGIVRLSKSEALSLGGVGVDESIAFQAPADRLVLQSVTVSARAVHEVATDVLGGSTQCRLEDAEGWPLVRLPASCEQSIDLAPGKYRWLQLPVTVDSRRRTRLSVPRESEPFDGDGPRTLRIGDTHWASLGGKGTDEYLFDVPARLGITFRVRGDLVGRLQRVSGATREPLELMRFPAGATRTLEPGRYALLVSHPRADKHVRYWISLTADALAPGLALDTSSPSTHLVRVATPTVVRLKTEGNTDTRLRLFREGTLLAEATSTGDDWNASIDTMLDTGDYRLVIETETGPASATRVIVAAPTTRNVEFKGDSAPLTLDTSHVERLPIARSDDVIVARVRASSAVACALADGADRVLETTSGIDGCVLVFRTPGSGAVLRTWATTGRTPATATLQRRPLKKSSERGAALLADVLATGRHALPPGLRCQRADQRGPLPPCDATDTTLAPGSWVFASADEHVTPALGKRIVVPLDGGLREDRLLAPGFAEAVSSSVDALHFLDVRAAGGSPDAPGCGIDGGVTWRESGRCLSVAGPIREGLQRTFAPATGASATIERRAVPLPDRVDSEWRGRQVVAWKDRAVRGRMPEGPWSAEVVTAGAWTVVLQGGRASDACAPEREGLRACTVAGRGGELVFVSGSTSGGRAELTVTEGDEEPVSFVLERVLERRPSVAGSVRLQVPATGERRRLSIEGAGPCLVGLDDGSFVKACDVEVPAGRRASVTLQHGAKAWRAVAGAPDAFAAAVFGTLPAFPGRLVPGRSVRVTGAQSFDVAVSGPSVVLVRGRGLVCALVREGRVIQVDGDATACRLVAAVDAGPVRIAARVFAEGPAGFLDVQVLPRLPLSEGVGEETWLAPGESKLASFTVAKDGSIGLGLQAPSDALQCRLVDAAGRETGRGCQQFTTLPAGTHHLELALPADAPPMRVRPVLLGLGGPRETLPDDVLEDLFARIGATR